MLAKPITYFGREVVLICDKNCAQAWGLNSRPTVEVEGNTLYIADGEQQAPNNPGTSEGGHVKPSGCDDRYKLNKWCARECERSALAHHSEEFTLPDWSTRRIRT